MNKEAPKIDELFAELAKIKGSDLHLVAGREPFFRLDGVLKPSKHTPLSAKQVRDMATSLLTLEQQERFGREKELDLAHQISSGERFRINVHWERGAVGLAARLVPQEIPTPKEIGLTDEMQRLIDLPNGLILLTGPTSCGKSTTLASLINEINKTKAKTIITLEDPIEFLFPESKSLVRQREVGMDTESFAAGLKHILRQDPNIIMIGEMRDLETISTALTVAETGHLVFATLHTNGAAATIERIIDVFPEYQQGQVRLQLAMTLRAVISQQLLIKPNGGRVAAREFLLNTPAVANLIRENKPEQIPSVLQTSAKFGMFSLEQDLRRLSGEGVVAEADATRLTAKAGK